MERTKREFLEPLGIKYEQFEADDSAYYNMTQHFKRAKEFLDDAKSSGGVALVNCALGVNRSGFICTAYLMVSEEMGLLEAVRTIKKKRAVVLCNDGFRRQLIGLARDKGLLDHMIKKRESQLPGIGF